MTDSNEIFNILGDAASNSEKELIAKAYNFAERAHEGQKRMSGEPYFVHVFEVAKKLAKLGMNTQIIAAGFLHDVIEDTNIPEEEIEKQIEQEFGTDMVFLVKGVTKLGKVKYRGYERHIESLRKFFMAIATDPRVVIIKFADRLHNLQTLQHVREDKRKRIAMESLEIYAPLANRLGMRKLKCEIEDAAFPYVYPKEFKQIEEIMEEKKHIYERNLSEIKEKLELELTKNNVKVAAINYRFKHKYSLWKKFVRRDKDVEKVYDIIALRVILQNVEDCYKVLGIIHSIWKPVPGRIKDFIAMPKPNGYRSLHTTIFTDSGTPAEIQIRTEKMHAEAAFGVAAHYFYKEKDEAKKINRKYNDTFKWIEDLKNLDYDPGDMKSFLGHIKMDFFNYRIFIFTPKGDVIDLPEGSTPIDFAYSVHSDVGEHIAGAKINGKMSHIFTKLKNRDIVHIIKKKDAHPSGKWLDHVKTSVAKKHIKSYTEKNSLLSRLKSFGRKPKY